MKTTGDRKYQREECLNRNKVVYRTISRFEKYKYYLPINDQSDNIYDNYAKSSYQLYL